MFITDKEIKEPLTL